MVAASKQLVKVELGLDPSVSVTSTSHVQMFLILSLRIVVDVRSSWRLHVVNGERSFQE